MWKVNHDFISGSQISGLQHSFQRSEILSPRGKYPQDRPADRTAADKRADFYKVGHGSGRPNDCMHHSCSLGLSSPEGPAVFPSKSLGWHQGDPQQPRKDSKDDSNEPYHGGDPGHKRAFFGVGQSLE